MLNPNGAKGYLVVSAKNTEDFYKRVETVVEQDGKGWQRLECFFTIPNNEAIKTLSIYTHKSEDSKVVYFDDFKISQIDTVERFNYSTFQPLALDFNISKKNTEKLQLIKDRYLSQGLIIQEDKDWVKAKLTSNFGESKTQIRYKGDWLDHLRGDKESFRVEIKSDNSWNGLQTFSIQSPEVRGFLNEWVLHQLLGQADVLSPRYDFVRVRFNDNKARVYAYEEHFTKNLVENQLRREGPILKFTEDRYWDAMNRNINIRRRVNDSKDKNDAFWKSELKPFKEGKTSKNPKLSGAFEVAQNLMHQYKFGLKPAKEVFDLDRMAKYLAILDIAEASHSLTWHNQRFYYNPVTGLLEPIGFDGYSAAGDYWSDRPLHAERVYTHSNDEFEPFHRIFYDKDFIPIYIKYLKEYSNPDFIQPFLAQLGEGLQEREDFIQREYPYYEYDEAGLIDRALKVTADVEPFSSSLQIFNKGTIGDSIEVQLLNQHILPLEVVAVGNSKIDPNRQRMNVFVFPQRKDDLPKYTTIKVAKKTTHIYYRLPGSDKYYAKQLPNWSAPKDWSPRQELLASIPNETDKSVYIEKNNLILFQKKQYNIESPLVLPKGKKVVIEAGAVFKFSKGGFLLSFSAVEMQGDLESPIVFEATDNQSGAVIVMQASQKSFCRHVIFKNQNTLAYKGWSLTGAVTFYESDVKIFGCQFLNNQCEDALNIVRSDFEVDKCSFRNIFGDAFDADFCNGTVANCIFEEIKNDALDFSTSVITIHKCEMNGVGDKAISAGEQATITATDINVKNANIGFASKDKSVLTLDRVTIKDAQTGFAAYQKKPEFG